MNTFGREKFLNMPSTRDQMNEIKFIVGIVDKTSDVMERKLNNVKQN